MSRWLVAALATLALVATGARAGTGVEEVISVHEGPPPLPIPLDTVLHRALAGDTIWWVRRLQGPAAPAARVAPDLFPRLRAILLRADRVYPELYFPEICNPCPDQLPLVISFGTQSNSANLLDLYVWFREAQVHYFAGGVGLGWASFRDDAPELLSLVKRTLPGDSVVQRYVWPPRPYSLPRADAPEDGTKPKFGEHVYVEELPEVTVKVPPEYPAEARKFGVDGTVMVQALVDRSGNVIDTRVIKSIPLLDNAAVAAVRQWKFKPATAKGKPVAIWVAIPIKFTLH